MKEPPYAPRAKRRERRDPTRAAENTIIYIPPSTARRVRRLRAAFAIVYDDGFKRYQKTMS